MPDPTPLEEARRAVIRKGAGCFVMFPGEIYDGSGMLEALDEFEAEAVKALRYLLAEVWLDEETNAALTPVTRAKIESEVSGLRSDFSAAEARHALTDSSERP